MSLEDGVSPRNIDVAKLQRKLVENNCNIGQGFRRIPALSDADYSAYNIHMAVRNG